VYLTVCATKRSRRPRHTSPRNCESQLRIATATLANATSGEITATTVVGVLGRDDVDAFQALLSRISDEFGLDARLRINVGSYSVRFSRRAPADGSKTSAQV
jgi:hypothetical protein